MSDGIEKLVGKKCACDFDMPSHTWPVPGYPAWVVVLAVSMPMIEMQCAWGSRPPFWINASKIAQFHSIQDHKPLQPEKCP
jgi:hypothetical protein